VGLRIGLDDIERRKFLPLPGLELRPLRRPARSQSIYRLRYPGSCSKMKFTGKVDATSQLYVNFMYYVRREYVTCKHENNIRISGFTLNITVFNATLSTSVSTLVVHVSTTLGHHQVILLLLLQLFHCKFAFIYFYFYICAPIHLLDALSHFLLSTQVPFSVFNNFKILILNFRLYDCLCGLVVKSFWLQIQRSRVRFSALPDFLTSRGSGTGSTQPRDHN
jgi:hypothetical protein